MDRLVEDLIQESMARGDFDNLSGSGKPLSKRMDHHNPYVDLVTHKINQVLIYMYNVVTHIMVITEYEFSHNALTHILYK